MEEINAVPNTKRRKERGKGQRENPPEKGNDVLTLSHTTLVYARRQHNAFKMYSNKKQNQSQL